MFALHSVVVENHDLGLLHVFACGVVCDQITVILIRIASALVACITDPNLIPAWRTGFIDRISVIDSSARNNKRFSQILSGAVSSSTSYS